MDEQSICLAKINLCFLYILWLTAEFDYVVSIWVLERICNTPPIGFDGCLYLFFNGTLMSCFRHTLVDFLKILKNIAWWVGLFYDYLPHNFIAEIK